MASVLIKCNGVAGVHCTFGVQIRVLLFNLCESVCLVIGSLSLSAYKTGGVVISDCLGVAKGLQHRVGLDDLFFKVLLLGIYKLLVIGSKRGNEGGGCTK